MDTLPAIRRIGVFVALATLSAMTTVPCAGVTRAPGEKIVSFSEDVTVHGDASIEVREEFVVHSEESYFKYGMVRHLPITPDARKDRRYVSEWKDDTGIRFKILEVTEDGRSVSYQQGSGYGYSQLRIGKVMAPLAQGDHTFVVRYWAESVLRPLADRDQLYWNVLGYNFDLPIDEVTVRVRLPAGIPQDQIHTDAEVGSGGFSNLRQPDTEIVKEESSDGISYRATNLRPAQTLSVAFDWPKGFIKFSRLGVLAHDTWLLGAPIALSLYYLIVWIRIGQEPALGSVPVRYEPPAGLSPAAVRYIRTTGSDGRTLAAVIAQLAGRGCIEIEPQDGKYKLTQLKTDANVVSTLAPEEARVLEMLFEDGTEIALHSGDGNQLNKYLLAIQGQLQKRLDGVYFTRHVGYILLGTFASLLMAMTMALLANGKDTTGILFLTWWFFFCGTVLGMLTLSAVIPACKLALRGMGGGQQLLVAFLVLGVFGTGFVVVLRVMIKGVSPSYALGLLALVVVNVAWMPALKRMTGQGRQAIAEITGFRAFLEKVEQDRMQRLNAAGGAPEDSVEFVPYAIALEVKEAWGDHLATAFFATTTSR
jgi:hypothetical protein